MSTEKRRIADIRRAVADYIGTEGCSCCRDIDGHEAAAKRLGRLLDVKPYDDGSGYNFYAYRSKKHERI